VRREESARKMTSQAPLPAAEAALVDAEARTAAVARLVPDARPAREAAEQARANFLAAPPAAAEAAARDYLDARRALAAVQGDQGVLLELKRAAEEAVGARRVALTGLREQERILEHKARESERILTARRAALAQEETRGASTPAAATARGSVAEAERTLETSRQRLTDLRGKP